MRSRRLRVPSSRFPPWSCRFPLPLRRFSDVITTLQDVLTSVSDAVVLFAQLPSDLASLLGVTAVDKAVITAGEACRELGQLRPRMPR